MGDGDARAAWTYHDATKHSAARLRSDAYQLDWDAEPAPYKLYADLPAIPLPRAWPEPKVPALAAIAGGTSAAASHMPTLAELARLLLLSAGITKKVVYANGRETYFRAAACTGALYHVDLYVVCGAVPALEAGVYHFGPHDFALRRLRAGDYRNVLVAATAEEPAIANAAAVIVSASTVWRNAWKYRARTYRHCWWDDGTLLANALAAAAAADMPARVVLGFVDAEVDRLLALDAARELALSLLAVGHDASPRSSAVPDVPPLTPRTAPPSASEVPYAAIHAIHAASALHSADEVHRWRERARAAESAPPASGVPDGTLVPVRPLTATPDEPIDSVIRRRGSSRAFTREPIAFEELSTILVAATRGLDTDMLAAPTAYRAELFLIVHAVAGLEPGTYTYRRAEGRLELLRAGDFRREAGFLALGQELAADASVNCYLLVDLHRTLDHLGARGYRAAQVEAAITGGRVYLAAYALRLGATGLTFFDDAVTEFFAPRAAALSVMFLVAVGRARARATR